MPALPSGKYKKIRQRLEKARQRMMRYAVVGRLNWLAGSLFAFLSQNQFHFINAQPGVTGDLAA